MFRLCSWLLVTVGVAGVLTGVTWAGATGQGADMVRLQPRQDIQRAIEALPEAGGEVRLAEGVWQLAGPITINKSNVALMGSGWNTVLLGSPLRPPTHWDAVIHIRADNVQVSDLKILHPFYPTGYSGIRIEQKSAQTHTNVQLERLWITSERNDDAAWTWSSNIWICSEHLDYYAAENVSIRDCMLDLQGAGRHNILISSGRHFVIEKNILRGCSSDGAAIWIEPGKGGLPIDHVKVVHNIIEDDDIKLLAQDFNPAHVTNYGNSVVIAPGIGSFVTDHGGSPFAQFKVVGRDAWLRVSAVRNPDQIVLDGAYPQAPYTKASCRVRMSNKVGAKGIDVYIGEEAAAKDYEIAGNVIRTKMQFLYITGQLSDVRIINNLGRVKPGVGITRGAQQVWLSTLSNLVVQGNYFEAYNTLSQGGAITLHNCNKTMIAENLLSGYRSYGIQVTSESRDVVVSKNLLHPGERGAEGIKVEAPAGEVSVQQNLSADTCDGCRFD